MAKAERKCISEFQGNETIESVFLVKTSALRTARNGSMYLQVEFGDATGSVRAMCWNASQALADKVTPDSFVFVKGKTELYQGKVQLVVASVRPADPDEVNIEEFVPASRFDVDEMWAEFRQRVDGIEDEHLAALMRAFVADEELVAKFRRAPAAVTLHHPCVGGLLEHTLSVMRLSRIIGERYEILNPDMLLTGAVFHDIGKTEELAFAQSFYYTEHGMLVGHITTGVLLLERLAAQVEGFPAEKLDLVRHLILSHHGVYEFGAPMLPVTAEAVVLHLIDNIDAKMEGFRLAVERDPSNDRWTGFERMFQSRRIFKGDRGGSD